MNFLSRLLASVGMAALIGPSLPTAATAQGTELGALSAIEQNVQATFSQVDPQTLELSDLRAMVDQVVAAAYAQAGVTPEFVAATVAQSITEVLGSFATLGPTAVEAVQSTVAASVLAASVSFGYPVEPAVVAQAVASGVARGETLGEDPTTSAIDETGPDVASTDDGRSSPY